MSCEGVLIEEVMHKGVTIALEGWHSTDRRDGDDECSACDQGSDIYAWFALSEIKPRENGGTVMEEITADPLGARPTRGEMERVAELIAAKDEHGLADYLSKL